MATATVAPSNTDTRRASRRQASGRPARPARGTRGERQHDELALVAELRDEDHAEGEEEGFDHPAECAGAGAVATGPLRRRWPGRRRRWRSSSPCDRTISSRSRNAIPSSGAAAQAIPMGMATSRQTPATASPIRRAPAAWRASAMATSASAIPDAPTIRAPSAFSALDAIDEACGGERHADDQADTRGGGGDPPPASGEGSCPALHRDRPPPGARQTRAARTPRRGSGRPSAR